MDWFRGEKMARESCPRGMSAPVMLTKQAIEKVMVGDADFIERDEDDRPVRRYFKDGEMYAMRYDAIRFDPYGRKVQFLYKGEIHSEINLSEWSSLDEVTICNLQGVSGFDIT